MIEFGVDIEFFDSVRIATSTSNTKDIQMKVELFSSTEPTLKLFFTPHTNGISFSYTNIRLLPFFRCTYE